MHSNTRIISRALVASLLVFVAACSDSGDGVLYSGDLPTAPETSPAAPEPPGGNWGGAWMELEDPVDLTAYSQSDLVFAIKMPEIVTGLEVKIEGLNPSDGSMFLENYTPTDLGDGWRQYRIPLADFVADGLQLDQIKIPFALWNPMAADGSFPEVDILFDAIRFE